MNRYVLIKLSIADIVKPVYRTSNYFTEIPFMRPFPDYIIYPQSYSHSICCKNRGVPSHYCCLYPLRIYMKVCRFRIGAFLMLFIGCIHKISLFSGHRAVYEPLLLISKRSVMLMIVKYALFAVYPHKGENTK